MIKFFRRIRQRLLVEKRLGRYFFYAIGEIVLVVIGILIALQINNANDNRKNRNSIDLILKQVRAELAVNIKRADQLALYYRQKDSSIRVIMNNQMAPANIDIYYDMPIRSSEVMIIKDQSFQNLMRNHNLISSDLDSIVYNLKELYTAHKEVVEYTNNVVDKIVTNYEEWLKLNADWYKNIYYRTDSITPDQRTFFFSENSLFKNFASEYYDYAVRSQYSAIMRFRHFSYAAYKQLSDLLEISDDELLTLELTTEQKQKIIGEYHHNEHTVSIIEKEDKLFIRINDGQAMELLFLSNKAYVIDRPENWLHTEIVFDDKGDISGFVSRSGNQQFVWKRLDK